MERRKQGGDGALGGEDVHGRSCAPASGAVGAVGAPGARDVQWGHCPAAAQPALCPGLGRDSCVCVCLSV